jgi:hypothetical protein
MKKTGGILSNRQGSFSALGIFTLNSRLLGNYRVQDTGGKLLSLR